MKKGRQTLSRNIRALFSFTIALVLAIAVFTSSATPTPNPSITSSEIRGVWITNVNSGVLFLPWAINRALHQLAELNFNTVYPVIWNRGTTFYRSGVAQRVTGHSQDYLLNFTRLGRDILSEIVVESHRQGLKVIPWFEYGFMAPINSQVVRRHPDWVTQSRFGKQTLKDLVYTEDVANSTSATSILWQSLLNLVSITNVWLNPLHPEVQRFIEDLLLEVVIKYDIDGIQLDDHFGMPAEFGYDAFTIQLYQKEHNGKSPPDDPQNPEWRRWRANKISEFTSHLYQMIKAAKPDCIVSLSPNPYEYTYDVYLQDWLTWVNQGWVDELVLQVYRDSRGKFISELEHSSVKQAQQKIPVSVGVLSGTFRHAVSLDQMQEQVIEVRNRGFKGVSFFYWETLWSYFTPDSPRQRRRFFQALFSDFNPYQFN